MDSPTLVRASRCDHELSPRLPRRQFRRRRQACGAGAHSHPSSRQAGGLPRARYPRRRRPLRPGRPGGERSGMARGHCLLAAPVAEPARALIAPYLDAVAGLNPAGRLVTYPGSPALMLALLRPQDRLIACELEPNAAAALARHLGRDRRSKAIALDGWTALNAYVPPKAPRPGADRSAFRGRGRFSPRLAQGLEAAHRKWPGGSYLLWYPIKERAARRPGAAAAALRDRQEFSRRDRVAVSPGSNPPRRLRSDRGQSAWTLAERARRAAAGAGDDPGGQGRRPPRRLARRRKLVRHFSTALV